MHIKKALNTMSKTQFHGEGQCDAFIKLNCRSYINLLQKCGFKYVNLTSITIVNEKIYNIYVHLKVLTVQFHIWPIDSLIIVSFLLTDFTNLLIYSNTCSPRNESRPSNNLHCNGIKIGMCNIGECVSDSYAYKVTLYSSG